MSIKTGVGLSGKPKAKEAGFEACRQAMDQVDDPQLIIVFSSIKYNQEDMLAGVRQVSKDIPLIGCSDAGEITREGSSKESIAVMALKADNIKFTIGTGGKIRDGAREAGIKLVEDINSRAKEKIKCLMILSDVLTGNGADIVRGIQDKLGEKFLIMGGAAGDDFLFKKTYVYYNDKVLPSSLVGVGLSGDYVVGVGVRHGWIPIGLSMKVSKSNGAILEQLDNKPAVSIYENYFGKKAEELRREPLARMAITYPLGMSVKGSSELLIRDPVTVDDKGAITCAAEIPQGSEVRIMIGSKEEAIEAAKQAAQNAVAQLKGKTPRAAIIFNCIARNKLFGKQASKEIEAIGSIIGKNVPLIGFYTYGEIAPLGGDLERCFSNFHNETVAILVLGS